MRSPARRRPKGLLEVQPLESRALLSTLGGSGGKAEAYVASLYTQVLNRAPDPQGQAFWANAIESGASRRSVLAAFENAPEAQGLSARRVSNGGATARLRNYVDSLYETVLQRAPDAEGEAFWVGRLRSGATRNAVRRAFQNAESLAASTAASGVSGASAATGTGRTASQGASIPGTPPIGFGLGSVLAPLGGQTSPGTSTGLGNGTGISTGTGTTTGTGNGTSTGTSTGTGATTGTTVTGGNTPTSSASFIGPLNPFATSGNGLTTGGGLGTGGASLTPSTSLGSTGLLTPGLGTTSLGATGAGASTSTGTLGNVLQTNGLSGPTVGNVTGTGGTGV